MVELTVAQVVGLNVRQRRDQLGMTAAELGAKVGEAFGKPWPRQTVYLMESGERAMVAAEVAALAVILDVSVPSLFRPPAEPDRVTAGGLEVPAETLAGSEPDLDELARLLRVISGSSQELATRARVLAEIVATAQGAFAGVKPDPSAERIHSASEEAPAAEEQVPPDAGEKLVRAVEWSLKNAAEPWPGAPHAP